MHHNHPLLSQTMTYSRLQNKMTVRRKLHLLRKLTDSKSVKRSAIVMDALLYINKLKLKLEALQREYVHLMQRIQHVKVEKLQYKNRFLVRVRCKKGADTLVSILEALEEIGLWVVHSKVSCSSYLFGMDAIVEGEEQQEQAMVTETLLKAIHLNQLEF